MTPAAALALSRLAQIRPSAAPESRAALLHELRDATSAAGLAPRAEAAAVRLSFGEAALDAATGGLPGGRVSELVGGASCGKTSLLLRALAAARAEGRRVALVDLTRTVTPEGAWTQDLLVVRPRKLELGLRALDVLLGCAAFSLIALRAPASLRTLPEALRVRASRLCRESGTALLSCSEHPLFGACTTLRLDLAPRRDGRLLARVAKSRQGEAEVTAAWRVA